VTAVGMFAGRGDVVLAMLIAGVACLWLGWWLRGRATATANWWQNWRKK